MAETLKRIELPEYDLNIDHIAVFKKIAVDSFSELEIPSLILKHGGSFESYFSSNANSVELAIEEYKNGRRIWLKENNEGKMAEEWIENVISREGPFDNVTEQVNYAIETPYVKSYMASLEEKVGKLVDTQDLLPPQLTDEARYMRELPIEQRWVANIPDTDYSVRVSSSKGRAKVGLVKSGHTSHPLNSAFFPIVDLAEFKYRGAISPNLPTA